MNVHDSHIKHRGTQPRRLAAAIPATALAIIVVMAAAACGSGSPPHHLSVDSGFDPCRDIPLTALNNWNANPTPTAAPSSESDGNTSHDPELKSCEYDGKSGGSAQGLTLSDSLYVGLTRISVDYFNREVASGEPSRDTEIDGRKVTIKGPYSTSSIRGRYTNCDIYVQMNGGGLLLTSVKAGDACQFLTGVAQEVVLLLPSGS